MHPVINHVVENTIAHRLGIKKGDVLISLNGSPVRDVIDYMYHSGQDSIEIEVLRDGKPRTFSADNPEDEPLGMELKAFRTKKCRNKCMFCFVGQLPKNLRK